MGMLTVANEHFRVLCRREMAHAFHRLMLAASDLVAGRLTHLRRVGPVVLARQHVHRALLGVDAGHSATAIPAAWIDECGQQVSFRKESWGLIWEKKGRLMSGLRHTAKQVSDLLT